MTEVSFTLDDGFLAEGRSTVLRFTLASMLVDGDTIHRRRTQAVHVRDGVQASIDLVPGVWQVLGLADTQILIEVPESGPVDLKDLIVPGLPPSTPIGSIRQAVAEYLAANPPAGGGGGGGVSSWDDLTGKPASFPPSTHTHAISDVSDLGTALDGKAPTTRAVTAGTGLTGGGTLAADRAVSLSPESIASLSKADTAVQPGQQGSVIIGPLPPTGTPGVLYVVP